MSRHDKAKEMVRILRRAFRNQWIPITQLLAKKEMKGLREEDNVTGKIRKKFIHSSENSNLTKQKPVTDSDVHSLGRHANRHKKRLEFKATADGEEIRSVWNEREIEYREEGTVWWKSDRQMSGEKKWTAHEWEQWQNSERNWRERNEKWKNNEWSCKRY